MIALPSELADNEYMQDYVPKKQVQLSTQRKDPAFNHSDTAPTFSNILKAQWYLGKDSVRTESGDLAKIAQANAPALADRSKLHENLMQLYDSYKKDLNKDNLTNRVEWANKVLTNGKEQNSPWFEVPAEILGFVTTRFGGAFDYDPGLSTIKFGASIAAANLVQNIPVPLPGFARAATKGAAGAFAYGEVGRTLVDKNMTAEESDAERLRELGVGATLGIAGYAGSKAAESIFKYFQTRAGHVSEKAEKYVAQRLPVAEEVTEKYDSVTRDLIDKTILRTQGKAESPYVSSDLGKLASLENRNLISTFDLHGAGAFKIELQPIEKPPSPLTAEDAFKIEIMKMADAIALKRLEDQLRLENQLAGAEDDLEDVEVDLEGTMYESEKVGEELEEEDYELEGGEAPQGEVRRKPKEEEELVLDYSQKLLIKNEAELADELFLNYKTIINRKGNREEKLETMFNYMTAIDPMSSGISKNLQALLLKGIGNDAETLRELDNIVSDDSHLMDLANYYIEGAPIPDSNPYAERLKLLGDNIKRMNDLKLEFIRASGVPLQEFKNWLPQNWDPQLVGAATREEFTDEVLEGLKFDVTFERILGKKKWKKLSDEERMVTARKIIGGVEENGKVVEEGIYDNIKFSDAYGAGAGKISRQMRYLILDGPGYVKLMGKYGRNGKNILANALKDTEQASRSIAMQALFAGDGERIVGGLMREIKKSHSEERKTPMSITYTQAIDNMRKYLFDNQGYAEPHWYNFISMPASAFGSLMSKFQLINAFVYSEIEEPIAMMVANSLTPQNFPNLQKAMDNLISHALPQSKETRRRLSRELTVLAFDRDIDKGALGEYHSRLMPKSLKLWSERLHTLTNNRVFNWSEMTTNTHKSQMRADFQKEFGFSLAKNHSWRRLGGGRDLFLKAGIGQSDWEFILKNKDAFLVEWSSTDPALALITGKIPLFNSVKASRNPDPYIKSLAHRMATAQEMFVNRGVITSKTMSKAALFGEYGRKKGFLATIIDNIFGQYRGFSLEKIALLLADRTLRYQTGPMSSTFGQRLLRNTLVSLLIGAIIYHVTTFLKGEKINMEKEGSVTHYITSIMEKGDVLPYVGQYIYPFFTEPDWKTKLEKAFTGTRYSGAQLSGVLNLFTDALDLTQGIIDDDHFKIKKNIDKHFPGAYWLPTKQFIQNGLLDVIYGAAFPDAKDVFDKAVKYKRQYSPNIYSEWAKPGKMTKWAPHVVSPSKDAKDAALKAEISKKQKKFKKKQKHRK
jgi:hypothetical protein